VAQGINEYIQRRPRNCYLQIVGVFNCSPSVPRQCEVPVMQGNRVVTTGNPQVTAA
jgi:hypothetical protein